MTGMSGSAEDASVVMVPGWARPGALAEGVVMTSMVRPKGPKSEAEFSRLWFDKASVLEHNGCWLPISCRQRTTALPEAIAVFSANLLKSPHFVAPQGAV